jgi:hypothetical protein
MMAGKPSPAPIYKLGEDLSTDNEAPARGESPGLLLSLRSLDRQGVWVVEGEMPIHCL